MTKRAAGIRLDTSIIGPNLRSARLRKGVHLEAVAAQCAHHAPWLYKVESGTCGIDLDDLMALARILDVRVGLLLTGTDYREEDFAAIAPAPAMSDLDVPWTPMGAMSALRTIIEDGDGMNRRKFLAASGSTLTAAALAWAEGGDSAALATGKTGGQIVTHAAVDNLDVLNSTLRRLDEHLDRPTAMVAVRHNLDTVRTLLTDRSYTESVGRRLHGVAAEMLRLCGRLAYESNDQGLAQRYWRAGKYQAAAAGDRALGANIVAFESDQAYDQGDMRTAADLGRAARIGYTGDSPRLIARFALQEAVALGSLGERAATERCLAAAFDNVGDFNSTPGPDWSHWVDAATVHAMAGTAYLGLQDWVKAEQHALCATQIAGSWADSVPHELSRHRIRLASIYTRRSKPDVEQAVALGEGALDLLAATGATPPAAVVQRAKALAQDLSRYHRNPQVRSFSSRVRTLSAA
jgi:transcriptional regulator with XRE-family HTH domain